MSRGKATTADVVKLWVIEAIVVAGVIYAAGQRENASVCGTSGTDASRMLFECFVGALAKAMFPWLLGGAAILGILVTILTVLHAVRSR